MHKLNGLRAGTQGRKLYFFNDPSHGWVKVKKTELIHLGIADSISRYSYMRGDYAYLEEDCDATLYFKTLANKLGLVDFNMKMFRVVESHTNKQSKIRSYESYKAQARTGV